MMTDPSTHLLTYAPIGDLRRARERQPVDETDRERLAREIGERLVQVRATVGITQAELAASTGISKETISRYENGRLLMTVEAAHKIADATRADVGFLLTGHVGGQESPADYPALADFLATELGRSATSDEVAALRSLRASDGRPTVATYQTMLLALRSTWEHAG